VTTEDQPGRLPPFGHGEDKSVTDVQSDRIQVGVVIGTVDEVPGDGSQTEASRRLDSVMTIDDLEIAAPHHDRRPIAAEFNEEVDVGATERLCPRRRARPKVDKRDINTW
jgi:hypothetical protein